MMAPPAEPRRRPCQRHLRQLPVAVTALLFGTPFAGLLAARAVLGFVLPRHGQSKAALDGAVARRALMEKEAPTKTNSEWRLGVGRAIDVLRRDVVEIFNGRPHTPDLSIYSEKLMVVDARLPSFRLEGLASYERVLSTLQWSVRNACESSTMEITAMTPPVNNKLYMRWRLKLVPKDPLRNARGFFFGGKSLLNMDEAIIVEGYSNYEFDAWSAEIVKLTIDITNPPTYIMDVLRNMATVPTWAPLATPRVPSPFSFQPSASPAQASLLTGGTAATQVDAERPKAAARRRVMGATLSLPQTCEDDYECNDGKANYPLRCCEFPFVGNICCEPDDYAPTDNPAWSPLPVPVDEEPWGMMGRRRL